MRLATAEDLERLGRLVIGFPVPPPADEVPPSAEPPADPDEQQG
jgi:hypothetical protein